jgi:flagellar basal-body rod modification protein FlgD
MTSLNPISGAAAGSSTTPRVGTQPTTDVFLRLLVAQMKTQDPLEPMKGTEFITQLAQFNSVEQLIEIRGELDSIRQAGGMSGGSPAAGGTSTPSRSRGAAVPAAPGIIPNP